MDPDWGKVLVPVVVAVGGGLAGFYRWSKQRADERAQERQRINALYLLPTLFAAEDLQSRLYNILDNEGLAPLQEQDPDGRFGVETVYLLARYLAWEQLLLRFTYLATDPEVARATGDIRRSLASDVYGTGAWTLFRPTQAALGQAVTCWRQGGAVADTVSLLAFRDMWRDGLGSQLGLEDEAEALREAHVVDDLPAETVVKLAVLQANLVGLLRLLEARLSTQDEKFTVGLGDQRRVSARLPLDRGT